MKDVKDLLLKSAMIYGLILGLFWAFKYVFFILSISYPFLSFVYWGLTFSVPFLLALLILHFSILVPENRNFARDWTLGVLIFFFAALVVSLEHYVFYRYLAPPNYIADSLNSAIDLIRNSGVNEDVKKAVESMSQPTPIQMTLQGIFNNVLYGVFVSLPVASITSRIKIKTKNNRKQD
ncbi:DUF4199 domain-containing protein [Massilibacteroides sp.]|uniref:DUF4199 domain-containing protein n=1 Tax=Massilibacteroides sp. TaxID=2034766 RepID=UPI002603BE82|nr:DUF4199 domain-containing protein [Massilibacteroides sp.]MDD4515057.1 DUF4199 domain-containing protein [Massilibacteroides sp.]